MMKTCSATASVPATSCPQCSTKSVTGAASRADRKPASLSGVGIRPASFCLGVLQALVHKDVLSSFGYLSTVSGGG